MKTLTDDEAVQWINGRDIFASVERDVLQNDSGQEWVSIRKYATFQPESPTILRIHLQDVLYYRLASLADLLLPHHEGDFQPCLLWFTDWGMWNEHLERVAYRLINLLRAAHGEDQPLIKTPGHLFEATEVVDAQTLLAVAMFVSWDVYVIPAAGDFLVHNSHHEFVDVISRSPATHQDKINLLGEWGVRQV